MLSLATGQFPKNMDEIMSSKSLQTIAIDKMYAPYGMRSAMIYWNGGKRKSLRYYRKNRARLVNRCKVIDKRKKGSHKRIMTLGRWYNKPFVERAIIAAGMGTFGYLGWKIIS